MKSGGGGRKRFGGGGGGGGGGIGGGMAMKFRPPVETSRSSATGKRPVAEAASVAHVVGMMVVHLARKVLYGVDISMKVRVHFLLVVVTFFFLTRAAFVVI